MKLEVEQEEDGRWIAEIIGMPGAMAYGRSAREAIEEAREIALRPLFRSLCVDLGFCSLRDKGEQRVFEALLSDPASAGRAVFAAEGMDYDLWREKEPGLVAQVEALIWRTLGDKLAATAVIVEADPDIQVRLAEDDRIRALRVDAEAGDQEAARALRAYGFP